MTRLISNQVKQFLTDLKPTMPTSLFQRLCGLVECDQDYYFFLDQLQHRRVFMAVAALEQHKR
jgi:hypothetical protein